MKQNTGVNPPSAEPQKSLMLEVLEFCEKWGPKGSRPTKQYKKFVHDLRTLCNGYAAEALRAGALPDSEYHICAKEPIQ